MIVVGPDASPSRAVLAVIAVGVCAVTATLSCDLPGDDLARAIVLVLLIITLGLAWNVRSASRQRVAAAAACGVCAALVVCVVKPAPRTPITLTLNTKSPTTAPRLHRITASPSTSAPTDTAAPTSASPTPAPTNTSLFNATI